MEQQGIWLFGNFIVATPALAPPAVPVRRLIIKFDDHRYPCPLFSPLVRTLLNSMRLDWESRRHRPRHMITHTLTASDVNKGLCRLTIPRKQVAVNLKHFLKCREERFLQERDADGKLKKIPVTVVDPLLKVRILGKNWSYTFTSGWTNIINNNCLAVGNTVQIWRFRGFLIIKI